MWRVIGRLARALSSRKRRNLALQAQEQPFNRPRTPHCVCVLRGIVDRVAQAREAVEICLGPELRQADAVVGEHANATHVVEDVSKVRRVPVDKEARLLFGAALQKPGEKGVA